MEDGTIQIFVNSKGQIRLKKLGGFNNQPVIYGLELSIESVKQSGGTIISNTTSFLDDMGYVRYHFVVKRGEETNNPSYEWLDFEKIEEYIRHGKITQIEIIAALYLYRLSPFYYWK